jgi:O-methyltransferase
MEMPDEPNYYADYLAVWHRNMDFLREPRFVAAYRRGMDSGHHIMRAPGSKDDIHVEWRVHVILWAAQHASRLEGDFVECGVNTGMYSLAICDYLDFARLPKRFYLFDTYRGLPEEQVSPEEEIMGVLDENSQFYSECYETARRNFAPYPNAVLVRGKVPDTLPGAGIGKVCYLSIDMNIVLPEIAALEFFWDKLSPGAPVVLDDYGWAPHRPQKEAIDEFARGKNVPVAVLPTGQGLILKPPA